MRGAGGSWPAAAVALASTKRASEAAAIAVEAAELVAASDGRAAAADYLAEVANLILLAGTAQAAWAVARHGLTFAEGRRDSDLGGAARTRPRSRGRGRP